MTQFRTFSGIALAALTCTTAAVPSAHAQMLATDISDVVEVTMLPGWREADGTHIAGLRIQLAPGWKTYWRAPGDGGVPTRVDLSASHNLTDSRVLWPTPEVFRQNGMRSIGYRDEVVVPLRLQAAADGEIALEGHMDFGVCEEVCLPVRLDLQHLLPADGAANVDTLSAALENRPMPAAQADMRNIECHVHYGADHGASIEVTLDMPAPGGRSEALVIEPAEPAMWVSEPVLRRNGDVLRASAEIVNPLGDAFRLDLSKMRFTVLTTTDAVDIQGCE